MTLTFNKPEVKSKGGLKERYDRLIKDNELFLVMDIVKEKLAAPDQEYKATVIDGDKAEAFQSYCAQNNISVML